MSERQAITRDEWLAFEKTIRWADAYDEARWLVRMLEDIGYRPPETRSFYLRRMAVAVEDIARALRLGEDSDTKDKRTATPEVAP